jgi:hypothetical protein
LFVSERNNAKEKDATHAVAEAKGLDMGGSWTKIKKTLGMEMTKIVAQLNNSCTSILQTNFFQ